jgi:hypothetical protein
VRVLLVELSLVLTRAPPVIVTDNIPGIGFKGEIKTVRPGFARNQLFPKKMAVYDTPGAALGCVRALF